MSRRMLPENPPKELPHPAEDLSADDDLLSWILVDQLGCMPNTKLGVHPQQVKFVGPSFKTDEVLNIVRETVTKGNLQLAMQRLQEFHVISEHLAAKEADLQRDRFVQRYLMPYLPTSRLEIHLTSRYSAVTGHTELAVYATRCMTTGVVLQELQGSVVPLPEQWRLEMEIGEGFAVAPEGDEEESDSEDEAASVAESQTASFRGRDKGKAKEGEPRRRSDRTKRRDFSIVWSSLKRCYQLFLGPARFLNHDCNPNVELLRQGKYVTFRTTRAVRTGDELTTFYGDSYFGKDNIECLCLTCEQSGKGGFTPKDLRSTSREVSLSVGPSTGSNIGTPQRPKPKSSSSLRKVYPKTEPPDDLLTPAILDSEDGQSMSLDIVKDESVEIAASVDENEAETSDDESTSTPKREKYIRKATANRKVWSFLQRPRKTEETVGLIDDDLGNEPEGFVRCVTCCAPLYDQVWFLGRYFDHCQRCIRHALIFELPWPAHRAADVQEYPKPWLFPSHYIPRKISSYDLPSLSKAPKKKVFEVELIPLARETKADRAAARLRAAIEKEEFIVEQLREAAWQRQEMYEQALADHAAAQARKMEKAAAEKQRRLEEKQRKTANKIKGTGVWQFYEYISPEVWQKRIEDKNKVTSGTRRGGRFRDVDEEEEMRKLAEEKAKVEVERVKKEQGLISPTKSVGDQSVTVSPEQRAVGSTSMAEGSRSSGSNHLMRDIASRPPTSHHPIPNDNGHIDDSAEMTAEHLKMEVDSPDPLDNLSVEGSSSSIPAEPPTIIQSSTRIRAPRVKSRKRSKYPLPDLSPSADGSVKRRGRPKGSGHLQRAAAHRARQEKFGQPSPISITDLTGIPSPATVISVAESSNNVDDNDSDIVITHSRIRDNESYYEYVGMKRSRSNGSNGSFSPVSMVLIPDDKAITEDIPSVNAASIEASLADEEENDAIISIESWDSGRLDVASDGRNKGKGKMVYDDQVATTIVRASEVGGLLENIRRNRIMSDIGRDYDSKVIRTESPFERNFSSESRVTMPKSEKQLATSSANPTIPASNSFKAPKIWEHWTPPSIDV